MDNVNVLVCDSIHKEGIKMLKNAGFNVDLKTNISSSELLAQVKNYDALVVRSRTKVIREIILASNRLKVIARAGVGLDNIDLHVANEKGIHVLNSPEAPSNAVAELVIGLMLSLARKIPLGDASMKKGEWIKKRLTGFELSGKTLGILGFGRIGFKLAKKAKAFDMKVITYDIIIDQLMKFVEEAGAESVPIETLYEESDFISIHVPLLPETKHMIGAEEIQRMKDNAYLINAARGGVINEVALKEAIETGKLAGAALDVFEVEPPINTSLIGLEKVIALPHIGAATIEAQLKNSVVVAEKLIKHFSMN